MEEDLRGARLAVPPVNLSLKGCPDSTVRFMTGGNGLPTELIDIICAYVHLDVCCLFPEQDARDACDVFRGAASVVHVMTGTDRKFVMETYLLDEKDMRRLRPDKQGRFDDRACRYSAFKKYGLDAVEFGAARVAKELGVQPEYVRDVCSEAALRAVAGGPAWEKSDEFIRIEAFLDALNVYGIGKAMFSDMQALRVHVINPECMSLNDAVDSACSAYQGREMWWWTQLEKHIDSALFLPLNLLDALHASTLEVTKPGAIKRCNTFMFGPWIKGSLLPEAVAFVMADQPFPVQEPADALHEMYEHYKVTLDDIQEFAWPEWTFGEYRDAIDIVRNARPALIPFFECGFSSAWYENGYIRGVHSGNGMYIEDLPYRTWYAQWYENLVDYKDYVGLAEEAREVLERWDSLNGSDINVYSRECIQFVLQGKPLHN